MEQTCWGSYCCIPKIKLLSRKGGLQTILVGKKIAIPTELTDHPLDWRQLAQAGCIQGWICQAVEGWVQIENV